MSFTVKLTSQISYSETLVRNAGPEFYSAWNVSNRFDEVISVAASATVSLVAATTYIVSADPLATVVIGWIFHGNAVEIPVNQLTVVAPPSTPYLCNVSTTGNSIPVRVLAIS